MNQRPAWMVGLAFAVVIAAPALGQIPEADANAVLEYGPRPNIVLILADDLGVDLVEAYANLVDAGCLADPNCAPDPPATPTLNQLASEGLLFTRAWANPVCSPTRAQILTGQHGYRSGIGQITFKASGGIHFKRKPLAWELEAWGYDTAAVGKYHLRHVPEPNSVVGLNHPTLQEEVIDPGSGLTEYLGAGFNYYAGSLFNLANPKLVQTANRTYDRWEKTINGELIPDYCVYATIDTVDDAIALFDPNTPLTFPACTTRPDFPTCLDPNTDLCADFELQEPWFLYIPLNAPHGPFHYPRDSNTATEPLCPLEPNLLLDASLYCMNPPTFDPTRYFCDNARPMGAEATQYQQIREMVEAMDLQLARLLCRLEEVDPNAYIIFVGDNGTTGAGIAPSRIKTKGKATLYQGGLNVPLIVKGPGVRVGTCDALVSTVDLFETITELSGHIRQRADSASFYDCLFSECNDTRRETVYSENFKPNFNGVGQRLRASDPNAVPLTQWDRAIRNDRWKLIRKSDNMEEAEFYDLATDPFEEDDRFDLLFEMDADPNMLANYCALKCELVSMDVDTVDSTDLICGCAP